MPQVNEGVVKSDFFRDCYIHFIVIFLVLIALKLPYYPKSDVP